MGHFLCRYALEHLIPPREHGANVVGMTKTDRQQIRQRIGAIPTSVLGASQEHGGLSLWPAQS